MQKSRALGIVVSLVAMTLLAGCLFGPEQDAMTNEIDPPLEDYAGLNDDNEDAFGFEVPSGDEEDSNEEGGEGEQVTAEEDEFVPREIYVFDHQGFVVPLTIEVPKTQSVATQALEYLVIDGPVTQLLPNGMRAVLPPGTEASVNIIEEEKRADIDFSNEFSAYAAADEKGILEAITWTLTQFDSIDHIRIMINGYTQEVMPINGTPIRPSRSRADGINVEVGDWTRIGHNSVVMLYFKAQSPSGQQSYYVPVSRVIQHHDDLVLATVQEYIKGPKLHSGLYSDLDRNTEVLNAAVDGSRIASLDFSEHFLTFDEEENKVSDDVIHSLTLSLTEAGLVEEVEFMVNGDRDFVTFTGTELTQSVSRPQSVNQAGF